MFTDSHCHLASGRFPRDELGQILARAEEAGVHGMMTLATSLEDVQGNLEIANDVRVRAAVGIHPCEVHEAPDDAVERLADYVGDGRVCAIGETGLDYYHAAPEGWDEAGFRKRQQDFLRRHFELAAASGLNVVVHTRDGEGSASFEDALGIYGEFSDRVRAVFHCFVGGWDMAARVIKLGGLVSFGGVATFKNADLVKDSVRRCPAGGFLLESDSPYLAPEPMRGKRNEPAFTMHTARVVADLRGESLEELAAHTEEAVGIFFGRLSDSA
ncbi:MAG: TatD family hydrolase [Armatimonadetes bacterium]|nr:TatD family hydrolase [Akkermansiaceae bacterium]